MQSSVQHHDGKGEDVGSVFRLYDVGFIVLEVLQRKHLHWAQGGGGREGDGGREGGREGERERER